MNKLQTSSLKLGIMAGGQLGKMLIQEASKLDIACSILDDDAQCPASGIASRQMTGSIQDYQSVCRFGRTVDILTVEIEHVNTRALKTLKAEGIKVAPDPEILELIQDKGLQKEFYAKHGIPTARFILCANSGEIEQALESGELRLPFVQKTRKGGYDGRGVAVIDSSDQLAELLDGPSLVEEKVRVGKELSVVAARNLNGDFKAFPVVEMCFDAKANLVDTLICPAGINESQSREAVDITRKIMDLLKMEGVLAVEFFLDDIGRLLVNEMAPRPHNSGHHTIESVQSSQYEQHLRAILNLPLGSTEILSPSVMINILGAEGHSGPVFYQGLAESLAIDGVKIHLYGKKETRPYRKMGHVTVLAPTIEAALEKAGQVKRLIRVESCKQH